MEEASVGNSVKEENGDVERDNKGGKMIKKREKRKVKKGKEKDTAT